MANLPEKNITLVDKITSIPSNSNLFLNADGEFRQASVNDVIKSATVVSDTVNNAINNAMQDSIDSHFKQATGSPILLTDTADGTVSDFKAYGRSTQDGEPTPDSPIAIKSVADSGYFDGELLANMSTSDDTGVIGAGGGYVLSKNYIPCKSGDIIKFIYAETMRIIRISFYDVSKNHIATNYFRNVAELEKVAPSNSAYFLFSISNTNSDITPATAKHITVTINGKYALKVKNVEKNLLHINKNDKAVTYFNYTEYTNEKVKGTAISTTNGAFLCSYFAYLEKGKTYFFSQESTNLNSAYIYSDRLWGNNIGNVNMVTAPYYIHNAESGMYIIGYYDAITSGTEYSVVKPMLRRAEVTDDTYEPYKETVTYIPLNEPLRSNLDRTVTDEVSLTEVTRKFAEVVYDGSSDENWNVISTNTNTNLFRIYPPKKAKVSPIICSHFIYYSGSNEDFEHARLSADNNPVLAMWVNKTRIATVDEWKTWLQANPITVVYELAEPVVEEIEPVDIVTYDNVTYLTASDNAEMELEYPTSKVAGIASIGYSKGRKAEYEVELLKAQLLELQTAMVNSL